MQEYIIKEKRVSNFAIANIECVLLYYVLLIHVTWEKPVQFMCDLVTSSPSQGEFDARHYFEHTKCAHAVISC